MIPTTVNGGAVRGGSRERVGAAIQLASARTGVDFNYLLGQARIESGLNPNARARTSSATGLFQFIDQTWLGTVRQHGAEHGLGWAADAIRRAPNGRYYVPDAATRQAILDLRRQPEAASAMAAEFASDNGRYLQSRLGRPAEPVDLYLAHFLGAGGAARFLRAHDSNPNSPAAAALPAAARANRAVFYNRDGSARSFAQIRERFASRIGGGAPAPASPTLTPDFPSVQMAALNGDPDRSSESALDNSRTRPIAGPTPQYARLAYLMLAQLGD
jgi:hypothetical protein